MMHVEKVIVQDQEHIHQIIITLKIKLLHIKCPVKLKELILFQNKPRKHQVQEIMLIPVQLVKGLNTHFLEEKMLKLIHLALAQECMIQI
jgi:hypothetical protein